MKKFRKYIIVIILFVIIMISILIFFLFRYDKIHLINKASDLVKYVYNIDEGIYNYKYGVLDNGNIIDTNNYIDGIGKIEKDKYNNVRFYIETNEYCISKTYLGKITINKDKCNSFKDLDVSLNKNNTTISFNFNDNVSSYMISDNDDFNGKWNDIDNNLVLNYYEEGKHYIWFKDNNGNISKVIQFNIECLNTTNSDYDKNIYYCNGSTTKINNEEWIIINNTKNEITLMKYLPLSNKLSHCSNESSSFCNKNLEYRWSNSYINYYLNNDYIKNFNNYDLVSYEICDDVDNKSCDDEYCGGYTRKEIEDNKWKCDTYTESKIRIINYYEYTSIVNKIGISFLKGVYWMSDISLNKGYSVTNSGDVFIYEDYNKKLDIRPIITIKK